MKTFLDDDFVLQSKVAQTLYHKYAENQPIFDFHNHLSPQEIYENKSLGNLANAWLDHDHYKWRAMRAAGIPESLITGHINKDGNVKSDEERGGAEAVAKADYARYLAFVETLQLCVGNPLYHWSHLELARYFGITEPVTASNAKAVWDKCNALLAKPEYGPRGLLEKLGVKELCTTDDPVDSLEYHKKIAADWKNCKVRPSFRPDLAINAENPYFASYISRLEEACACKVNSLSDLLAALSQRMDFFKQAGSVVSDHSLENDFYLAATPAQADQIFKKALAGNFLTHDELAQYKGYLLIELGKLYAAKGFVMQIHIGALRDQNAAMFDQAGKNIGEDSLQDFNFAPQIGAVLNGIYSAAAKEGNSPKVILYNLNPKDNEALATMAANFRNCQFGPAWWFNDHKDGIEEQIRVYARTAPLGRYVGMLTDSRSFLSYPRHEYFRRILCNFIGNLVENGEFPYQEEALGNMVKNICYQNSVDFFLK
ncbi:MAG: glucuronate isomerase [Treponema sp.]|nr:glucuronate isomerase [Treponema sp.]